MGWVASESLDIKQQLSSAYSLVSTRSRERDKLREKVSIMISAT